MKPSIYKSAEILNIKNFTIDNYSQIDGYVFLNAGEETKIGKFVHIACFCSIVGGGKLYMEDFSALSAGCRVITGTDDFLGEGLAGPTIPQEYRKVVRSTIHIGRHALMGTNAIIFPGVSIGEGAVAGAGCIVRKNLEPWTIYVGSECKPVKLRNKQKILEMESNLLREKGYIEA